MSRKQTRKSVSIKGSTYRRIKSHCDAAGITMSSFFEDLTIQRLGPPSAEELQEVDLVEEVGQREVDATASILEAQSEPQLEAKPKPIEVRLELESEVEPEHPRRPRHRGSPIPDALKPSASAVQDQPEALTGYVPPILEF